MNSIEEKILAKLDQTLPPFDNYVAKMEIEENYPLARNREYVMKSIVKASELTAKWKIIPVIGETGQGKTFLYWKIKENINIPGNVLFMDVPPNPKLFFYDLYTNMVGVLSVERLREITRNISDRWGANELKYGLFRVNNPEKILDHAQATMRYKWSQHKAELLDCMKIIILHAIDPEKMALAERWMLGEIMDPDELYFLGIQRNLSAPYMAEEMLKLFADYVDEGFILFYDDIDVNWDQFQGSDNWEADWADGHLDPEKKSLSSLAERNFFEMLIILMKYTRNLKIIMTMDTQNLPMVLDHFPERMKFIIHPAIPLLNFSTQDTKEYYLEIMEHYLQKQNLIPAKNIFFPLSESLLMRVFLKTAGNPRKVIRELQMLFDQIIFDKKSTKDLEESY